VGGFSFSTLGGGLDVQSLVSQLMYVERAPVRRLDSQVNSYESKIKAYNQLNSKLSELLSSLENLNDPDVFSAKLSTSSGESYVTAAADGSASEGTYLINVSRLALWDNFASDNQFSSSTETIGTGSFDLQVGDESATVTIDSSNNTLNGLRDAINNAGLDVNAGIIHDGTQYRLTITAKGSGSENAISISNNTLTLADGSTPITFSRTHDIADASELDAALTVNGLDITSSSNTVENVIDGVTLDLKSKTSSAVTVGVRNDTETVKANIEKFVDAYNSAYQFLNSQFAYVESVGRGGVLAGEYVVRDIQAQLAAVIGGSVSGLDGAMTTLASAGIDLQNDGTLQIDSTALGEALDENFDEIASLFVAMGTTTNSRVSYVDLTNDTQAGTYQVNITAVPEAATVTAPNSISTTLGVDETLTFSMSGKTSTVSLLSDMTIEQVVNAINTQLDTDGLSLSASQSGTSLLLTSDSMGDTITFSVVSDTDGAGTGIGTGGMSDTGASVAGNFTNTSTGETFAAKGSGSALVGTEGDSQGLRIRFSGDTAGTYGTVAISLGFAEQLSRTVDRFTDSYDGPIHNAVKGFESTIDSLKDEIDGIELRLVSREANLTDQFNRANEALQQLTYLQSTLAAQLGQLI